MRGGPRRNPPTCWAEASRTAAKPRGAAGARAAVARGRVGGGRRRADARDGARVTGPVLAVLGLVALGALLFILLEALWPRKRGRRRHRAAGPPRTVPSPSPPPRPP